MSVYIAILAVPFLMMAGLVVDGGGALVAKQRAADEAGQAARSGANQLDLAQLRATPSAIKVDPALATTAIADYFALAGNSGNTGEPHLHIHAQGQGSTAAPLGGEPIHIKFNGRFPVRGDRINSP